MNGCLRHPSELLLAEFGAGNMQETGTRAPCKEGSEGAIIFGGFQKRGGGLRQMNRTGRLPYPRLGLGARKNAQAAGG